MPCEDQGTDWSDTAASQGIPKRDGEPQEAGKRQGRIPQQVSRERGPAKTLISDF